MNCAHNPQPQGWGVSGGCTHENRHGHHQAFQARRGPRRSDRDRRARDDRDGGQGLRASEGPYGKLSRRRICGELLAEDQDRGRGGDRSGRQDHRHHHHGRQDRPDRRRKDLRPHPRQRRAHPHRRNRHRCTLNPHLQRLATGVRPMTFKKPIRAGLVALALGLLLGLFLSISAFNPSYAEEAAPAAAPAAEAPPACAGNADPKLDVLEKCSPHSGDTAWMMTSVALVLMMTIPGLGLFYGGMVRKKNVGDTIITSFAVPCLVTVLFALLTYSMAFRAGTPFIGGLDRMFLRDIVSDIAKGIGNPNPLAPTIPESVYICFQMTFAIITPALIAGAFAERMKFSAMLWFIGLWAIFVYAPIAHWVWGPDGFLASGNDAAWVKVLDFAGGTVVHINAGVAGLMCAIMLGKRREAGPEHNMVLTFIGASLLWVGWFGFNAGAAVSSGLQAGMAMLVTQIATAVAG